MTMKKSNMTAIYTKASQILAAIHFPKNIRKYSTTMVKEKCISTIKLIIY